VETITTALDWMRIVCSPFFFVSLAAISPFFIWAVRAIWICRSERDAKLPQQEKLLRPAGHSLSLRLDDLLEKILQNLLVAAFMMTIAAGSAGLLGILAPSGASLWLVCTVPVWVAATVAACGLTIRSVRQIREVRKIKLGMRGEQAVAEGLTEVADLGFRVFHDLQPEGAWNIDHVVVGTRGAFVIETKARRKYPSKTEQRPHELFYDGLGLTFPSGFRDRRPIEQARRNAAWLADFVGKKTAEVTAVEAVVVLPGWYTKSLGNYPVKVMNAQYLVKYLRQPA
jgi:hypothetical protein